VRASLDSRNAGNSIRRGGNPTNNPQWVDTYLSLNRSALYATRHHPSVVGYAVANGTTTGYNIYESYLLMKSLEPRLPIIYEGASGEWCSDRLPFR
jgi:beta-galactosidase